MRKTYEIRKGPPATRWDDYVTAAVSTYSQLLDGATQEREVQEFLEKNPCFLPGAFTPSGGSGHAPLFDAVVTQPVLPGILSRQPDFVWLAKHSLSWFPTLIEIESPRKTVFRKDYSSPRAEFSQARHQIAQWRAWFEVRANVDVFISMLPPANHLFASKMEPYFILVYGRRNEFKGDKRRTLERANLMTAPDEDLMSFDRLTPDPKASRLITVKMSTPGKLRAVAVPPTFEVGPFNAEILLAVDGMIDAIVADDRFTDARKEFLGARIPYWREWSKMDHRGMISYGDRE